MGSSEVLLWSRLFQPPIASCSASFSTANDVELDCRAVGGTPHRTLVIDVRGNERARSRTDAAPSPLLTRIAADPATWGGHEMSLSASQGQLEMADHGGILWGVTGDDAEVGRVVRVDPEGVKLWSREVVGLVVAAAIDPQRGVVVGGMVADQCHYGDRRDSFVQQGVVTRLSATGQTVWMQRYPCGTVVTSVRATGPNEVAIMGTFQPTHDHDEQRLGKTYVTTHTLTGDRIATRESDGQLVRACSCTLELMVIESEGRGARVELRALR
jgi:hypothetical protein